MKQITIRKKSTTLLVFLISSYIFFSSSSLSLLEISKYDRLGYYTTSSSSSFIFPIFLALVALLLVVVVAVRTTMVTWITVMVLLAFAGKRRRVLVKEGRYITSDVAMYLAKVFVRERSLVAFACASFISMVIAMACLTLSE